MAPRGFAPWRLVIFVLLGLLAGGAVAQQAPDVPELQPGTVLALGHRPDDPRKFILYRVTPDKGLTGVVTLRRIGESGDAGIVAGTKVLGNEPGRAGLGGLLAVRKGPDGEVQTLCFGPVRDGPVYVEIYTEDNATGAWDLTYDEVVPGLGPCEALPLS
ncbi:hypothetical protein [Roseisalinus antarcticus]|uniref:Uncharacterized protein n=1 Tax=Roseisalinus antarcticus TaxID=254357 RepID=A0A1Y5SI52_9RHOB|nr:hypothetical protein [Roseisalinus antarcticus]SLN40196.1 hypothetical protein ROA7023_01558 [Roseisalinus antarcticus]